MNTVPPAAVPTMAPSPALNTVESWYTQITEYFSGYPQWAIDVAIFSSLGFMAGFVAKLFHNIVLILALSVGVLIFLLQAYQIITIDLNHLQALLGLGGAHSIADLITITIQWAQEHILATISLVVGFIAGWKVG